MHILVDNWKYWSFRLNISIILHTFAKIFLESIGIVKKMFWSKLKVSYCTSKRECVTIRLTQLILVPAIQAETILYFVRKSRWVQNDVRKCFFSFLSSAQMDVKFENNGGPETLLTHQRRQNFFVFDFREIWIWYLNLKI